ncbi:MAG: sugar ABC transporter ATP-binding protein [Spirochaetaceae bacterium]|nr:MAG: sugar ABC transporter ATP-binding protein [Spirochaetaceae bacterium]
MAAGEVHCLVGENGSGKSTLVKIITGVVHPDHGTEVWVSGTKLTKLSPYAALQHGIQVVHQDLSLFPNLSVAENIASHKYAGHGMKLVEWRKTNEVAQRVLDELNLDLDLQKRVGELSVADQQLVAICRSIASEALILIMDEPTAALTYFETQQLFSFLRKLAERQVSVLFISHRLDEIFEIGNRLTVLRDGRRVGTYAIDELDREEVERLMTGKELATGRPSDHTRTETEIVRVEGLTRSGQYQDVRFELRSGEILGLIGPRGAGRTEVALSLFGLNPPDAGTIYMEGAPVELRNNRDAIRLGIGYLPENRLREGLVLEQSIENNTVVTNLAQILNRWSLIDPTKRTRFAEGVIQDFHIVAPGPKPPARELSGGNQQKLVLGKWVYTSPKCLILDSPTNGVDVGAKEGIRRIIARLAEDGLAILLISDEESEILANCPRTLIMREGKLYGPYDTTDLDEEQLRAMIRHEQELTV